MDDTKIDGSVRTIADVARLAGVTPSTVSRALAGKPGVRLETRQRIDEIVRTHHFSINPHARSLRVHSEVSEDTPSDSSALMLSVMDPFLVYLAKSIVDLAVRYGRDVELSVDGANQQDGSAGLCVRVGSEPANNTTASYRISLSRSL
jgi:DNA-binding LacI/PurR family transcriptional regulator